MLQNSGRLIAFVVLLIVCGAHSFSAHAQTEGSVFEKDGIKYKITSLAPNTAEVTSKSPRYTGAVNIPANVTAEGGETFSVTTIGAYAFMECKGLTSVTLPNSVEKIDYDAFLSCISLTSVTIPYSVTTLSPQAFRFCSGLIAFTVANDNPNYSSQDGVLFNKAKTELIQYPIAKAGMSYEIPNPVTTIGTFAFQNCKELTTVTFPNSVTKLSPQAFRFCSGLIAFIVADDNPNYSSQDGVLFDKAKTGLVQYPTAKVGLSYEIPNSVTRIEDSAFADCKGLTSVTIPNSVISIGYNAFQNCMGLISVTIPNSVKTLGNNAFKYCKGLISVTISNSVLIISYGTFMGCEGLTSVTIPNSVTTIEEFAFALCTGLTSIIIPNSVKTIGLKAFEFCNGLTSFGVAVDNSNYSSQDGVLFNKAKTELIKYPSKKAGISYEIPNSVKTVAKYAFDICMGLTSVTIPNSVTTIGEGGFKDCHGLTNIYSFIEDVAEVGMGTGVFFRCPKTTCKLKVPAGKQTAYQAADQWKDFTNIEEFQVYNISVAASVTNGTVTSVPNTTVTEGLEVTLNTMPNAGFKLKDGSLKAYKTGDETVTVAIANQKFIMPSYDVTVAAEFVLATGVETAIAETIVLSPNPASEFLYIKGLASRTQVDIYSVTGVLVLSVKAEPEQPISLGALKSGLYLVEVNGKIFRLVKR
ncbi:MAG: leucine-rich repeat domain-containing protein [Thiotrichales bacterium]|nr:leucine-rich repeat domain-containing protein [Thiotrichales bacterium]